MLQLLAVGTAGAAAGCTWLRRRPEPRVEEFRGEGPILFAGPPDYSLGGQRRLAVARWNEQNPGQEATYVELSPASDMQRAHLVASLQSGAHAYDVLALDVVWTAEFARGGYILPLDQVEGELRTGRFLPPVLETARFEDSLWGAPLYANAGLLYYRTDLVTSPPASWAAVAEQAARAAGSGGGYVGQLASYEGLTVNVAEAIWAHGGALVDAEGKVAVNTREALRGLTFLADGLRQGWIRAAALRYTEEPSREAFQTGNAVLMRNWPYAYELMNAEGSPVKGRFSAVRLPGVSALGGSNLAIARSATNRRTALEFIKFLSGDETQRVLFERGGFPATVAAVYEDPTVQAEQHYTLELRRSIEEARSRPITPYYGQVSKVIQDAVYAVLQGRSTPGRALRELSSTLEVALQGG
jgi:multiple sugar transport system substrate-binding protein